MAASKLFSLTACFKRPLFSLISSSTKQIIEIPTLKNAVIVRNMSSHQRVMENRPSQFEWRKVKDHLHFYTLLGVIPIVVLVTVTNVFIGPAELADTPEGYEPKFYEYYQHPISRWIARHIETPEHKYERNIHFIARDMDIIRMRRLENRVNKMLGSAGVEYHKKWYMVPVDSRHVLDAREKGQRDRLAAKDHWVETTGR